MTKHIIRPDAAFIAAVLKKRPPDAHKGAFGTVGVVAGSASYRGAAVLAAHGAMRSGAGIVRVVSTEAVCAAVAAQLPGATLLPLKALDGGGVPPAAAKHLAALAPSAVLAGCGLGDDAGTAALVEALLQKTACPLVLDADALNAVAREPKLLALLKGRAAKAPVVLTPHIGEMARLCGLPAAEVGARQAGVAADYAAATGCVVVLKSHATATAARDGALYLHDGAPNPGLAKGGSGDVLAGIIAGLLAQGIDAQKAAAAGVWLHAAAGRAAADEWGEAGLSTADLPLYLARVLRGLGR